MQTLISAIYRSRYLQGTEADICKVQRLISARYTEAHFCNVPIEVDIYNVQRQCIEVDIYKVQTLISATY